MILADKIIKLRKKNGWSQEELAERMNVSRQAVSKWESAQAVPDLEKILQLSSLFGVSTDYLLKDEIECEQFTDEDTYVMRRVSIDEANEYVAHRRWISLRIALATFLCILSPITLIVLGAYSNHPETGISETLAGIVGLSALFALVLIAVPIFILCGFKSAPYAFLDKEKGEPFELEYGVRGIIGERKSAYSKTYIMSNIIATCLCIISPLPIIISSFAGNDILIAFMIGLTMIIAGAGVFLFITAGVQHEGFDKLLSEGEYEHRGKGANALKETVSSIYWTLLTALYLAWSFLSGDWHITWLVWVVGGALSPAIDALCNYISTKRK